MTSKRLEILTASLAKKQDEFDRRLDAHMSDVKSANGQPLNDKRNGPATLEKWERQNDALRKVSNEIERTKAAIEREEGKIANVESASIPDFLREMIASGELSQWRRHPNTFFVPGVDVGRIRWNEKTGVLSHHYLSAVSKEQYPKFRDTFNKANAKNRAAKESGTRNA